MTVVLSPRSLVGGHDADTSAVGIVPATTSLVVMPLLSRVQRRAGRVLASNAVVADSGQTLRCTYLCAVLLIWLVLEATLGWSWTGPLAGLVIAAVAIGEGRVAWRGQSCSGPLDNRGRGGAETVLGRPEER